jgi:hypothetical protein
MTFQAVSYAADFLLHKVEYIHCQPEGKRSTRTNQQSSWHTMLEIHASALTTYDNSGRLSRTRRVTPTPWRLQQITTNKVVPPPSAGGSPVLPCCRFCSASSRTSTPFGESFATELRGKDHLYLRCKMCGIRTVAALIWGPFLSLTELYMVAEFLSHIFISITAFDSLMSEISDSPGFDCKLWQNWFWADVFFALP